MSSQGKGHRKLAAIMFTDMVGYSAMTQKNEALTLELLEEHKHLLRPIFPKYDGKEIATIGDAFFVEFASALDAAGCAIEIQRVLLERNNSVSPERQVRIRIGLHIGDVVHLGDHVHGDGVNIAARIEPLAEPGGICISEDVARQIQNKIDMPVVKLGGGELKNIKLPVNIYRIVLPQEKRRLEFIERLSFTLRRKRARRFAAGISIILILSLLTLVTSYSIRQREKKETFSLNKHRIAVLPFVNLSADAGNEYFADGMTEEMISQLSRINGLEVIARTSVMTYKGTGKNIAEIGRELNVGTVLEGSVRKAQNQVRITAQLINAQNQAHLWSQDYDRELKGVFVIQSDIARSVAEALEVQLLAGEKQEIEEKGTENLEAYNLYLKGRYFYNKAEEKEDMDKAIEYFDQAIEKDPNYALAYAGIADSYNERAYLFLLSPKENYPQAKAAAIRALEIDDNLAQSYTALAVVNLFYEWNRQEAERGFKRAIEINPNYAPAHRFYAWYFTSIGRHKEAIEEAKRARELDPVSVIINVDVGWVLHDAKRYDQAIEQLQKAIELDPKRSWPYMTISYPYLQKGMYEEALTALEKAQELFGERNFWLLWNLGSGYAEAGKRDETEKVLEELKELSKKERVSSLAYAQIYAALGEKDQAFYWLEKALDEHDPWLIDFKVFPIWNILRGDPRYREVLKKMNLE